MGKTKIQWTDMSWPVVTGCSHAGSPGCDMCYAARMAAARLKHHPRYKGLAVFENGQARWTGEVRLNHDVLEQPLHWKKPRMIFVASMSDWLHHDVPELFAYRILDITQRTPQHTYQFLTKRADRLPVIVRDWMLDRGLRKPPHNIWQGTSIENQAAADERIPLLLQTSAAVRFVSVEPMLGPVDLTRLDVGYLPGHRGYRANVLDSRIGPLNKPYKHLDWVICGGESGPGARPMHPDWARSLRNQCYAANVPFFFKQRGAWTWWDFGNPIPRVARRHVFDNGLTVFRVGKKRAGRLLDGRAWDEMPKEATCS